MVVESTTGTLLFQWQGEVGGELAVDAGTTLSGLSATFLDPDSARIVVGEECPDHSLRWELADTTVASIAPVDGNRFGFRLTGRVSGVTTVRFRIWHGDHADFTSLEFPVRVRGGVVHVPLAPEAVVVHGACSWISTWNYPPTRNVRKATGPLVVRAGAETGDLDVSFHDSADSLLAVPDTSYAIRVSWSDATRATAHPVAGFPLRVRLAGLSPGVTRCRIHLDYNGVEEYVSGEIPVVVEPEMPAPVMPAPSFWLKKNGVRCVIVRDGALAPSCGTSVASPGYLTAEVGETTDLYSFQLLDATCRASTPGEALYSLVFEFADPCIAGTVRHPEHWDEIMLFHIVGLAAGETTARIRLMRGTTLEAISPPIRVVITPAAPA